MDTVRPLGCRTVLDAFGGTGAVAHALKAAGYAVTYNDHLHFNHQIGLGLIENDRARLPISAVEQLGVGKPGVQYERVIEQNFRGIYFTDEENAWLDQAIGNIGAIENRYERALAYFAVYQACLAKRPYNLFHRKNLYMRTADVRRTFGNKSTWDRPFPDLVARFAREANEAVIDGRDQCRATCQDVMQIEPAFDLVYIDPPYINRRGVGVDYRSFYHFLEGMTLYEHWEDMIDGTSAHKRLLPADNPWCDPRRTKQAFEALFDRFRECALVVSYRSDGVPGIDDIAGLLGKFKRHVAQGWTRSHQYVLSTRRDSHEVLLLGLTNSC